MTPPTTTFEPHNVTCLKCTQPIGPCEEPGCINRYDHDGGLCTIHDAEETGKGWDA